MNKRNSQIYLKYKIEFLLFIILGLNDSTKDNHHFKCQIYTLSYGHIFNDIYWVIKADIQKHQKINLKLLKFLKLKQAMLYFTRVAKLSVILRQYCPPSGERHVT
jgi:hypothetical protein